MSHRRQSLTFRTEIPRYSCAMANFHCAHTRPCNHICIWATMCNNTTITQDTVHSQTLLYNDCTTQPSELTQLVYKSFPMQLYTYFTPVHTTTPLQQHPFEAISPQQTSNSLEQFTSRSFKQTCASLSCCLLLTRWPLNSFSSFSLCFRWCRPSQVQQHRWVHPRSASW